MAVCNYKGPVRFNYMSYTSFQSGRLCQNMPTSSHVFSWACKSHAQSLWPWWLWMNGSVRVCCISIQLITFF